MRRMFKVSGNGSCCSTDTDPVFFEGLIRVRDNLKAQLRDLSKQKPRGQTDENFMAEISRLESSLTVTRDDLVGASRSP